jgi:hypothetical protein
MEAFFCLSTNANIVFSFENKALFLRIKSNPFRYD